MCDSPVSISRHRMTATAAPPPMGHFERSSQHASLVRITTQYFRTRLIYVPFAVVRDDVMKIQYARPVRKCWCAVSRSVARPRRPVPRQPTTGQQLARRALTASDVGRSTALDNSIWLCRVTHRHRPQRPPTELTPASCYLPPTPRRAARAARCFIFIHCLPGSRLKGSANF